MPDELGKSPLEGPTNHGAPAIPTPASSLTSQQALMMAFATAIITALGTSGGLTVLSSSSPDAVRVEVMELRSDVKSMEEKIDDIYDIVDKAHPRKP